MASVLGRQAVVVVHGIGEQRPLSTLLGFVGDGSSGNGILKPEDADHWFINPDHLTQRLDLRRISVDLYHKVPELGCGQHQRAARTTHFIEYYWAHRFRDTVRRHLTDWMRPILLTRRNTLEHPALIGPGGGHRMALLSTLVITWAALCFVLADLASNVPILSGIPGIGRGLDANAGGVVAVLVIGYLVLAINAGLITVARALATLLATTVGAIFVALLGDAGRSALVVPWTVGSLAVAAVGLFVLGGRIDGWQRAAVKVGTYGALGSLIISLAGPAIQAPASAGTGAAVSAAIALASGWLSGKALRVFGDAARYFSNTPSNLEEREAVRRDLIALLTRLHDRRDPVTQQYEYDRIIVVGHSLGSVIAYDAISALWAERNTLLPFPYHKSKGRNNTNRPPLEKLIAQLEDCVRAHPNSEEQPTTFDKEKYRRLQRELWAALRADERSANLEAHRPKSRWIISDLVTVGSPLTYAETLLVDGGAKGLRAAHAKRLLFRCPPVPQLSDSQKRRPLRYRHWLGAGNGYETLLHHAAPFAPTAWTNIYYAHDIVGGPLAPYFGHGVLDVPARRDEHQGDDVPSLARFLLFYPHSSYWKRPGPLRSVNHSGWQVATDTLRGLVQATHVVVLATVDADKAAAVVDGIAGLPEGEPEHDLELRIRIEPDDSCSGDEPFDDEQDTLQSGGPAAPATETLRRWLWPGRTPWFRRRDLAELTAILEAKGAAVRIADRR